MPLRKAFIFRGGDRIEKHHDPLNYLDKSVEKLKTTLQEYGKWEVDDFVLKSSDDISDRLDGIEDSKENEILIFYVGHGLYKDKTKKYYLIGQNCKNIILDNIISPIKEPHYTRFTLIIDACYSNEAIKFVPKAENIDMLTSVFDGKAYENDDFEATSFVHHFCESIIGTDLAQDKPIYLDYICNKIFENRDERQKPILSPSLHTQYTNQIIIAKSKKKNFIPSVIKANAKYIKRDIDSQISQKIDTQTKELIIINAEGGFGKSTLLQNLIFEYSTTPMILIATQNIHNTTFVDLLLDDDLSVIQNCSNVNTIKKKYLDGEDNLEFELLEAIKEDFGAFGILMIDTFEKIKNIEIEYKIKFSNHGIIEPKRATATGQFRHYIDNLLDYMYDNTLFIIAGRNSLSDTHLEIDEQRVTELKVDKFNDANIKEYFECSNISLPSDKLISYINQITVGNAMLITLFPKIIKEYDNDWSALDFDEIKRRMQSDRENGLLYYLTDRILSHIYSDIELYKLIIPRVLNRDIEKILFGDTKVFDTLIDSGLAYSGKAKEFDRVYLHDSVTSAIVANAKNELTLEYASYHDNPKIIALHQRFIEYYQSHQDLHNVNSEFEICYHRIMLKIGFENSFEIERERFVFYALGSVQLNYNKKIENCNNFDNFLNRDIVSMIKRFQNDEKYFLSYMSQELYNELSNNIVQGKNIKGIYDTEFLISLLNQKKFKKDSTVYFYIGIAYDNKKEYDKAIESYQKALAINPKKDEAYINMGSAYDDKKEYDKAIESYQKALEINPKKDEAYYNMGIAYYHLGEFTKVIESYQKALHINPKKDEAYNNLFELQLTQNKPFDEVLEDKYIELFQDKKETFIDYEMLKVLEAIYINQKYNLSLDDWEEKYQGVDLDWGWDEIDGWIETIKDKDKKAKLLEAVEVFKGDR